MNWTLMRAVAIVVATLVVTHAPRGMAQVAPSASYSEVIAHLAGRSLDLDSLYRDAIRRREDVATAIRAAARGMGGDSLSSAEIMRRMRTDPRLVMHDPDSILRAYSSGLARARRILPTLFDTVPDAPLRVAAIPASQAASAAPAAYQPAKTGDSAVFLVNAYQPGGIARMNILFGIAHEAYPGHHFQNTYARAHGTSAAVNADNAALVEGWGIYAEQLGDEAGLYKGDETATLGYLIHLFDVFMALQIDIGVHAMGWSHAMAVDTMRVVAGRPDTQAESYANRHAATPGQLASYAIGYSAIASERERASAALGARFDLKRFHNAILSDGQSTFADIARRVSGLISSRAQISGTVPRSGGDSS